MNYTRERQLWEEGMKKEEEIKAQIEWEHACMELGLEVLK